MNVAYWNAHERPLERAEDGTVLAAGIPLKFFHFSGYEIDEPWRGQAATRRRGEPEGCDDAIDDLDVAGHEHATDERGTNVQSHLDLVID